MLGEPDGLVAELLGFQGHLEEEVGIEGTEGDAEPQDRALRIR